MALPFPRGEVRRVAIASLIERAERGEPIGFAATAEVGRLLGRSARTVYRDIAKGGYRHTERPRFRIEDEELTVLFEMRGNRRRAHQWLAENFWASEDAPSYSQFCRAADDDVHPSEWAAMTEGDRAARRFELCLILSYEHLYELLSIDAKQMSVFIQHSTKRDPGNPNKPLLVQPWVIWAKDGKGKAIPGVDASEDAPTHRNLLNVLRDCLAGDPELGPFRGRPRAVAWDRSTIHTADAVTTAMSALVIPIHVSDAYQPHQNGLIESFNALAESDFAAADPFYAHPPIQTDGRPFLPHPDVAPTIAHFRQKLRDWVADYNANWQHSALGNRTPVQAWEDSDEKPDLIPEEWLRFMHLDSRIGTVVPGGVRVDNDFFTAPELDAIITRRVDIRYGDDRRTVEVFEPNTGDWLCTAIHQDDLTPRQRLAVKAPAKQRKKKIRKTRHSALARQEQRAAATLQSTPRLSEREAAHEDEVAVAQAKARPPRSVINQPIDARGDVRQDGRKKPRR